MTGDVEFGDGVVHFRSYPYAGASVHPRGDVAAADLRDADPRSNPPELRLHSGETLFVSAQRRDEFQAWCEQHAILCRRRPDVWGALLEPFLDTEFTEADEARTATLLAAAGLGPDEVAAIRARFNDAMVAYNFESMLWDWVHLGLSDLLEALSGKLAGERHRLPPVEFAEVYWWAMAVADGGYDQNSSQA